MTAYDLASYFPETVDPGDVVAIHVAARPLWLFQVYADPVDDAGSPYDIIINVNGVEVDRFEINPSSAVTHYIATPVVLATGDRMTAVAGTGASGSRIAVTFKGLADGNAIINYDVNGSVPGMLPRGHVMVHSVSPRHFTVVGGTVAVGTPPTIPVLASVLKNGATVGTLTIDTAGALTINAPPLAFIPGDTISVVAPSGSGLSDAALSNVSITLLGRLTEALNPDTYRNDVSIPRRPAIIALSGLVIYDRVSADLLANRRYANIEFDTSILDMLPADLLANRRYANIEFDTSIQDSVNVSVVIDGLPATITISATVLDNLPVTFEANRGVYSIETDVTVGEMVNADLTADRRYASMVSTVTVDDAVTGTTVTVAAAKVASTMTDYPLFIPLDAAGFITLLSTGATNGDDLRAKDASDNPLPLEVVVDNTGDPVAAYVKVTLSSSVATDVVLYQDVGAGKNAVGHAQGRNAVWTDYAFVSHDGGFTDSKGSTMTPASISYVEVAGKMDIAADWVAGVAGSRVESSSGLDVFAATSDQTLQIWVARTTDPSHQFLLGTGRTSVFEDGWGMYLRGPNETGAAYAYFCNGYIMMGGNPPGDTNYHKFEAVNDNSALSMYVDNVSINSGTSGVPSDIGGLFAVGQANADVPAPVSKLDEIRVRASILSADWRTSEYENQNTPLTFMTIS